MNFLFDPTSYWLAKAADFWMGFFGFVITVLGFGVGLHRLRKVQAEVEAVKSRFAQYDAVFESMEIITEYDGILNRLDRNPIDWRSISYSMVAIKRSSPRIEAALKGANAELATEVRRGYRGLEKFIQTIDSANTGDGDFPEQVKFRRFLRLATENMINSKRCLEELLK